MSDIDMLRFYISAHYGTISAVRKKGVWASSEKKELCDWLSDLIRAYGGHPRFDKWELRHVMAYIFLVNRPFHCYGPGSCWEFLKRRAQDWVVANHPECVFPVTKGRFAGYQEIRYEDWTTHRLNEQWFPVRTLVVNRHPPSWTFASLRNRAVIF